MTPAEMYQQERLKRDPDYMALMQSAAAEFDAWDKRWILKQTQNPETGEWEESLVPRAEGVTKREAFSNQKYGPARHGYGAQRGTAHRRRPLSEPRKPSGQYPNLDKTPCANASQGCVGTVKARGLCNRCYQRSRADVKRAADQARRRERRESNLTARMRHALGLPQDQHVA